MSIIYHLEAMLLAQYEAQAEQFLAEMEREEFLNGAGLKATLDIWPIYSKHAAIFSEKTVNELLENRRKIPLSLADFAVRGRILDSVKTLTEEIENAETRALVLWDGKEMPFRQSGIVLANEPNARRRHELEEIRNDKSAEINPLRQSRLEAMHEEALALGFSCYVDLCDELRGLDLHWLESQMDLLLSETRDFYADKLQAYLSQIGVSPNEATTADLTYLFRAPSFDSLFPGEALVEKGLRGWLLELGIDLDSQANIEVDIEPRPLKSPRAFCAPINPPHEVKLVIYPRGGQDDYSALLHEGGHAEHFANVDPELPFAYRRLGDNSVTESYAFLFDNLMHSPAWLESALGLDPNDALVREFIEMDIFSKTYFLRRYAAKLKYEIGLHSGAFADPPQSYSSLLSEATMVKASPKNWLSDVDDFFYCSLYIRAWIFEVMHRRYLEKNFGERWFAQKEAGQWLISLWKLGQQYSVNELSQQIGWNGLDLRPLLDELNPR